MTKHRIDPVKDSIKKKAAKVSLVVSIIVLLIKFYAYYKTNSTAVLSDALESIVNVSVAVFALWSIYISAKPADEDHPYGHGKLEYFSAAFEGGLIFFAALAIFFESLKALIEGSRLNNLSEGFIIIIISGFINLFLGLYLYRVGKKNKSDTLVASGSHVMSDSITTGGTLIGLMLVMLTDYSWFDPLVAILAALNLCQVGYKVVRSSVRGLMDEFDPVALEELAQSVKKCAPENFIDIHQLRIIRSGSFHHVDAHLVVPEYWDIAYTHEWADGFEKSIVNDYPYDGEFAFHLDPCGKKYCSFCKISDCPIRQKPFEKSKEISVQSLTGGPVHQY